MILEAAARNSQNNASSSMVSSGQAMILEAAARSSQNNALMDLGGRGLSLRDGARKRPFEETEDDGDDDGRETSLFERLVVPTGDNEGATFAFLVGSASEVKPKDLDDEGRKKFQKSDHNEWDSIVSSGSVRIMSLEESKLVEAKRPDRIMGSRMVRRWKGQEGTFADAVAKSRWCVRGDQDPDLTRLDTYAPTPQGETLSTFLLLVVSLGMSLSMADCKNAFCQSKALTRKWGPLYVRPCTGIPLQPGQLVELVAPVYGLNDAPAAWRQTLTEFLVSEGYRKSMLDPCLYLKHRSDNSLHSLVLIEVDDLAIGCDPKDNGAL